MELKFYSANHYQIGYEIDDSDILITVYGYENYSVNRNVVMGTVRVLNGANQTAYGETGTFALYSTTGYDYDTSKRNFLTGNRISVEQQNLKGTFRNENFVDGFGDDVIETGGGNNNIELGYGGNNTVTLGDGANTINRMGNSRWSYTYKDNVATGGYVIKNADSNDTLIIGYDDTFKDHIEFAK